MSLRVPKNNYSNALSFVCLLTASICNICFHNYGEGKGKKVAECLSKNIPLECTSVGLILEKQQTLEELIQVIDCGYFFLCRLHINMIQPPS